MLPVSNRPLATGIGYWQQWQHSSGPLPAILRDLLLLVPSLWLTLREDGMLKVASGMTSLREVLQATMGDAD